MRKILVHIICLVAFGGLSETVLSQVPQNFNWQAVIRDSGGEVLENSPVVIKFTFRYQIWLDYYFTYYAETHSVQTNESGLVNLKIGTGVPQTGTFSSVPWSPGLEMQVHLDMGNGFTEISQGQMSSVPFAMLARDNWALKGNDNVDPEDAFIGTTNNAPLRFRVNDSEKMIIKTNGHVGIGTDDPWYDLQIDNVQSVGETTVALNRGQMFTSGFSTGRIINDGSKLTLFYSSAEPAIELRAYSGISTPAGLVINKNSEVGIGLADPLSIRTTLHLGVGSDASLTGDDSGYLLMGDVNASNMVLDQNEIIARNNGGTNTLFLNTSGGAVVINQNTTPGFDFAVNGSAAKPGGGSWSALSDARMKENVSPFSSGLDLIRNVKPVTFHYNQRSGHDTSKEYVGVIAQELQQVAPFMVEEKTMEFESGEKEDYLTVDPSAFTYLLINAVKELEAQNASQNKLIEELARQNQELIKRLDALERK